jgi:hypothetical protein
VDDDEEDDELICRAYTIKLKFINTTHLIRVSDQSREVVQRLEYTLCISISETIRIKQIGSQIHITKILQIS